MLFQNFFKLSVLTCLTVLTVCAQEDVWNSTLFEMFWNETVPSGSEIDFDSVDTVILGNETRRLLSIQTDWEVKLQFRINGVTKDCSGYVKNYNAVRTAAHCIFQDGFWATDMYIMLTSGGQTNGQVIKAGSAQVTTIWKEEQLARYDFGYVFTPSSVTMSTTGYYKDADCISSKDSGRIIGYPVGKYSSKTCYQSFLATLDTMLLTDDSCTTGGMSGSPYKSNSDDTKSCGPLHGGDGVQYDIVTNPVQNSWASYSTHAF